MCEMIKGLEGTDVIVDDIIVWGKDIQEHDDRLKKVFERAKSWNLKLSTAKCQFRTEEIEYVGHKVTKDGLKAEPEKVRAVINMKISENIKELQTFLGFITYLQKFMPDMSEISSPLRILLQKKVEWHWDSKQQESFDKLKLMASQTPVLTFYDKDKELILNVDSSSCGLGAVLLQEGKHIAYASGALNSTQRKYAQIEKETLAIVFGCKKFHYYLYGRHFTVESDHKPLESIFKKSIIDTPPRIQRFAMTLQKYDFTIRYKPGKSMVISDALSRLYLPESSENIIPELDIHEMHINAYLPLSSQKYESLKKETANDSELQALLLMLEKGWPEFKYEVPDNIHQYWPFKQEITSID